MFIENSMKMPVTNNLMQYGIQNKVNEYLLNKAELDFRETIKEIVEEYPKTKQQRKENQKSYFNMLRDLQSKTSHESKRSNVQKTIVCNFDDKNGMSWHMEDGKE